MSQTKRSRKLRVCPRFIRPRPRSISAPPYMSRLYGPDRDKEPVRTFQTFTDDLHRLADWFAQCGVRTVVMEPTCQRGTRSMCLGGRPTSATRNGCNACTNTDCCAPASGLRPKLLRCAPIPGSGSGCSTIAPGQFAELGDQIMRQQRAVFVIFVALKWVHPVVSRAPSRAG